MALRGNESSDYILGPAESAMSAWTCHLIYQNTVRAPWTTQDYAVGIGTSGGGDSAAFLWGHGNAAFQQAWYCFDGSNYTPAKYTTTLAQSTWYRLGGRVSASNGNLTAWLDGTLETTSVALFDGSIASTHQLCLLAAFGGTSKFDGGDVAEAGLWNVALSDGEMAALGRGYSPLLIRPGNLVRYLPLVRNIYDAKGGAFTSSGTTVQSHPRVIYPRRRQAFSVAAAAGGGFSSAFFRENAGVGAAGGGPFARANAGLGAIA